MRELHEDRKSVDMIKRFLFKNVGTVYAYSIEEAKQFLTDKFKIDNNVEELKRIAEEESWLSSGKYFDTYTEDDINSIVEMDYDKVKIYIDLDELLLEDAPYVNDIRPRIKPKGLALLPISKAKKYDSYKEKMSKIEIPSLIRATV